MLQASNWNALQPAHFHNWDLAALSRVVRAVAAEPVIAENQIIPYLGDAKIRYISAVEVSAWHAALLRGGLSPRTVGHAHRVLARALRRIKNIAALEVELPGVEEGEVEILAVGEISDVLAKLKDHALLPIVSLALATGMRRGELLGLQWGDIDFDAATLRVERSVEETKAGLRLKPPKTKRGRRNLKLPAEAVAVLRAHKVRQMKVRLALGMGKIEPDTLVFSTVEGELMRPRNLSKAWWRARGVMKLPAVTFQAFRHTHASMLIRAGVDILTISRRLGHSKAAITLDVYAHLVSGADEAAAAAIEGVLK